MNNTSLNVLEALGEALDCRPEDLFESGKLRLPITRIRRRDRATSRATGQSCTGRVAEPPL
jgi:hypothetical protein